MSRIAYCSECGRYVELAEGDNCRAGHPRSALRDVRTGALSAAAGGSAVSRPFNAYASIPGSHRLPSAAADSAEQVGQIIGWLVVLVPAVALGIVMVVLTEPQFEGLGFAHWVSWTAALASVALTLGAALFWGWLKFVRKHP